jgi:hypothetical protein
MDSTTVALEAVFSVTEVTVTPAAVVVAVAVPPRNDKFAADRFTVSELFCVVHGMEPQYGLPA